MTKPGIDADGIAQTEGDHFMKCPGCGQWFDMRDLAQVAEHVHDGSEIEIPQIAGGEGASKSVNKITWAQVGRVAIPGRYMFRFGWLTITADDLAIWEKYPTAAFTLYSTTKAPDSTAKEPETNDEAAGVNEEEFRLGTFELRSDSNYSESEK
jgi:hypothetical protein